MKQLQELVENPIISFEYEKAFWLKQFRDLCNRMDRDIKFRNRIMQLYRETHNELETTTLIIEKETNYVVNATYAEIICRWIKAHFNKKSSRSGIPISVKKSLWSKQKGKCAICGCDLSNNWSQIHVDHIVPWDLVGDELEDNLQDLCEKCNEEKSASTNYIFLKLIGLK